MKVAELTEGMYVVKNKDGKEKRFRDADSVQALDWKMSGSGPKDDLDKMMDKHKVEPYTTEWWQRKEKNSKSDDLLLPWDHINSYDLNADDIEKGVKEHTMANIEDWHLGEQFDKLYKDCHVRCIHVRVTFSYGPEDDLGLEDGDEPVMDSTNFLFGRDPKNPKKLIFIRYG